jgi:hypothetical protein
MLRIKIETGTIPMSYSPKLLEQQNWRLWPPLGVAAAALQVRTSKDDTFMNHAKVKWLFVPVDAAGLFVQGFGYELQRVGLMI